MNSTQNQDREAAASENTPAKDGARPDVLALMAEIRERVKADVEKNRDKAKPFKQHAANLNSDRKAGELLHSEDLRYLNTNYAFGPKIDLEAITSHRPGIIGKAIVKYKRKLLITIWDFLKEYFTAERDFHVHLVRYLNDMTKYVDARDAANFWELIRKIDVDITKALERIERIHDEQTASLRSTEKNIFETLYSSLQSLQAAVNRLDAESGVRDERLRMVESVARGLESIVARMSQVKTASAEIPAAAAGGVGGAAVDYSYLLLENRFRGSEAEIRERLRGYLPYFKGAALPVLEIGPGRGELLGLFKAAGIAAYGVDPDEGMCQACLEQGLDARLGDGVAHLRSLPDGSLGGVIAVQVVEHLTRHQLNELFALCCVKVRKGGRIIFETINPRSLVALSSNYFRDPTHVWPLHPDTLEYTMSLAGLNVLEIKELSPVAENALLRSMPIESFMTPRWAYTIELLNANFAQLNRLLYGFQDYCVVAEA